VQFEGRQYLEVDSAPDEEQLTVEDLGQQVGQTRCMLIDRGVEEIQDGDSAFLPAGTPLHSVASFDIRFRLAAQTGGEVLLFEVYSARDATVGRDVLDLDGLVQSITINGGPGHAEDAIARITDPTEIERVVQLVLDAPVDNHASATDGGVSYFLEFEFNGTPALSRVLYPQDNLLHPYLRVPDAFTAAIVLAVERA